MSDLIPFAYPTKQQPAAHAPSSQAYGEDCST